MAAVASYCQQVDDMSLPVPAVLLLEYWEPVLSTAKY
jgi:hypothetical protein